MNLAVIGCGNVGFAFLRWLKKQGHNVFGYDIKDDVKKRIREELGSCCCATSYEDIKCCNGVFICVPTESNKDGSADMSIYETVIKQLRITLTERKVAVIQRSTCPPGSAEKYAAMLNKNVSYAVNPSFLRKSTIEYDTNNPDRIAIGGTGFSRELLLNLYANITAPRFITDSYTTVELLKYIENTIDAMLIAYWNSILEYSSILKLSSNDLEMLIEHTSEKDKFQNIARVPGKAFGLWCLPKDLHALIYEMNKSGIDSTLFEAINSINKRFDRLVGTGEVPAQELIVFENGNAIIQEKGKQQIQNALSFFINDIYTNN